MGQAHAVGGLAAFLKARRGQTHLPQAEGAFNGERRCGAPGQISQSPPLHSCISAHRLPEGIGWGERVGPMIRKRPDLSQTRRSMFTTRAPRGFLGSA